MDKDEMTTPLWPTPPLWVIGATINVVGSLTVNLAANLMKLSHNIQLKIDKGAADTNGTAGCCDSNHLSPICYWRIGALLFALGSIVNFFSLGMAAQSLLAILGGVQFVSNIFFGKVILKEQVTLAAVIGTVFIICGLGIAVSFSDHRRRSFTVTDLIELYDETYIQFLVCVVTVLLFCEVIYVVFTNREHERLPLPYSKIVRPITYSIVSATVGTQSVLQSKCVAELLRTSVESDDPYDTNILQNGFFYLVFALFLFGLAFWLYRLNNALKQFDGLVIIPIIQVFWTLSAVVQGGFYFHEFTSMSREQGGFYFLGAAFVFSGVVCIASTATHTQSTPSPIPTSQNRNHGMMMLSDDDDDDDDDDDVPLAKDKNGMDATTVHCDSHSADEADALVGLTIDNNRDNHNRENHNHNRDNHVRDHKGGMSDNKINKGELMTGLTGVKLSTTVKSTNMKEDLSLSHQGHYDREEDDTGLINATTNNVSPNPTNIQTMGTLKALLGSSSSSSVNSNHHPKTTTTHHHHNNQDIVPDSMYFVSALEGRVLGGSLSGPIQSNHWSDQSLSDIESRHRVDCDGDSVGGDDSVVSPSIWQRLALFSSPIKKKDKHYQQQDALSESNTSIHHDHNRTDSNRVENLGGNHSHNHSPPDQIHDTPSALDDPTRPLLHPIPNQKGSL